MEPPGKKQPKKRLSLIEGYANIGNLLREAKTKIDSINEEDASKPHSREIEVLNLTPETLTEPESSEVFCSEYANKAFVDKDAVITFSDPDPSNLPAEFKNKVEVLPTKLNENIIEGNKQVKPSALLNLNSKDSLGLENSQWAPLTDSSAHDLACGSTHSSTDELILPQLLAHGLAHDQAFQHTVQQTAQQDAEQTTEASAEHTVQRAAPQPVRQAIKQTTEQATKQAVHYSAQQFLKQVVKYLTENGDNYDFWKITRNQASVLLFLINKKSCITRLRDIAQATGIPYGTVRSNLEVLVNQKFITKPQRYINGQYQGFNYQLIEGNCKKFIGLLNKIDCEHFGGVFTVNLSEQTIRHTVKQSDQQTAEQTIQQSDQHGTRISRQPDFPFSSSSFLKDPTTTNSDIMSTNPDIGYWVEKGLTIKTFETWIDEFKCKPEVLMDCLCHCRFDLFDLGKEESIPVKDPFAYFYGTMKKAGYYRKPTGYKSYWDKQIELERQSLADLEQKLKELAEIRQKKIEQEKELAFQEMMVNPEGELYKTCHGRLNHFAQKSTRVEIFEMAMRKSFDEVMAERDQEMLSVELAKT